MLQPTQTSSVKKFNRLPEHRAHKTEADAFLKSIDPELYAQSILEAKLDEYCSRQTMLHATTCFIPPAESEYGNKTELLPWRRHSVVNMPLEDAYNALPIIDDTPFMDVTLPAGFGQPIEGNGSLSGTNTRTLNRVHLETTANYLNHKTDSSYFTAEKINKFVQVCIVQCTFKLVLAMNEYIKETTAPSGYKQAWFVPFFKDKSDRVIQLLARATTHPLDYYSFKDKIDRSISLSENVEFHSLQMYDPSMTDSERHAHWLKGSKRRLRKTASAGLHYVSTRNAFVPVRTAVDQPTDQWLVGNVIYENIKKVSDEYRESYAAEIASFTGIEPDQGVILNHITRGSLDYEKIIYGAEPSVGTFVDDINDTKATG
ncbi:MAG: hypothetical protein EBY41_01315 [Proteobacteria bacterium]|jgi:hypothetical protein|nr:hypothetical protein [Pseudomonadota bacterium]